MREPTAVFSCKPHVLIQFMHLSIWDEIKVKSSYQHSPWVLENEATERVLPAEVVLHSPPTSLPSHINYKVSTYPSYIISGPNIFVSLPHNSQQVGATRRVDYFQEQSLHSKAHRPSHNLHRFQSVPFFLGTWNTPGSFLNIQLWHCPWSVGWYSDKVKGLYLTNSVGEIFLVCM